MVKKSFWIEEEQAKWVKKMATKRKGTESELIRFLLETELRRPSNIPYPLNY